eukprot:1514129-Rhodomonas_salina.1
MPGSTCATKGNGRGSQSESGTFFQKSTCMRLSMRGLPRRCNALCALVLGLCWTEQTLSVMKIEVSAAFPSCTALDQAFRSCSLPALLASRPVALRLRGGGAKKKSSATPSKGGKQKRKRPAESPDGERKSSRKRETAQETPTEKAKEQESEEDDAHGRQPPSFLDMQTDDVDAAYSMSVVCLLPHSSALDFVFSRESVRYSRQQALTHLHQARAESSRDILTTGCQEHQVQLQDHRRTRLGALSGVSGREPLYPANTWRFS